MRRTFATLAAGGIAFLSISPASAETIVSNDSIDSDFSGTTASAELVEGEMYEAVFDIPESWLPVQMLGVRVVMVDGPEAGAEYCAQFGIEVWDEGMAPKQTSSCVVANVDYKDPGMNRFSQLNVVDPMTNTPIGFEVVADPNRGSATYKDLRFSTINQIQGVTINPVLIETTRVRIGLRAMSDQCTAGGNIRQARFPVLLSDLDGVSKPLQNFVYGEPLVLGSPICSAGVQHYDWEDFAPQFANSMPGDWVMKLILNRDEPVTDPDMGMGDAGSDGGGDVGGPDVGGNQLDAGFDESDMALQDVAASDLGGGDNENNGDGAAILVESITPSQAAEDVSTDVVILGEGFVAGAEVLLGSEAIGVTETRSERIRATVPDGFVPGVYDVIVTNPDGSSDILGDGFTVTEAGTTAPKGGADRAGTSDGCCTQVRGSRTSSGLGAGIALLLLGFLGWTRRRA